MRRLTLLKKFIGLGLLLVAFALTSLHAQTLAYVTNPGNDTVSVINTLTNAVTASIPVGIFPAGVVASPDSRRVYVANFASGNVSVIDTATNTVVATITLAWGAVLNARPTLPAISPDGKRLYVPDFLNAGIFIIDTASNTVSNAVFPASANQPVSMAITRDGLLAYVLNLDGTLFLLDLTTNTQQGNPIVTPAASGFFALGIVIAADGRLYVPGGPSNNAVEVINGSTVTAIPLPNCSSPASLVFTPDSSRIYETCSGNPGSVAIFDAAIPPPAGSLTYIPVGSFPGGEPAVAAITPDSGFVYVTNYNDASVSVIDSTANPQTEVFRTQVGGNPFGIAIVNLSTPTISFKVTDMAIDSQNIHQQAQFTLGAGSTGINLANQQLTLTIGTFTLILPPGTCKQVGGNLHFMFNGTIDGLKVNFNLLPDKGSSTQFSYVVHIHGTDQTGLHNPVAVTLTIGQNTGTTTAVFK